MLTSEERWSSAAMPPPRQLSGFQEVFDRTHFHWALKSEADNGYFAKVRRRSFGDYTFTSIVCDPVTGFRTVEQVKQGREDYFCLLFFDSGNCVLRQGRNETMVRRDHIAIWDSSRPAMFACDDQLAQQSILIPHDVAKTVVPGIEDMCGLSVDGGSGLGGILLSHLRQLHRSIETISERDRPAVLRATVELVAAAFRPPVETASSTAFRRALLGRVQDHILANLGDPGLSAASVAEAFRFSPRYLHRLFEEFDVTVGGWIRRRRLLAARDDLTGQAAAMLSVTEIAMRRGFADPSHFSHAFKAEFGLSPRDYRRAVREGGRP